ncbi:MAG TPA: hypothetical protein VHG33_05485 [Woeseiaceae bacterium]|nr:hypothetical protein [Woeseiaceae bacterium]
MHAARGRPVGAFVGKLREWEQLDRSTFRRLGDQRLREALRRAASEVPLYGTGDWRAALAHGGSDDIRTWPVLERDVLRAGKRDLIVRQPPAGMFYRHSSASTGASISVAYDPEAAAWSLAGEHRAALWHGIPIGVKMLQMRGGRNFVLDWIEHSRVIDTKALNAVRLDEAARWLLEERPHVCMGLPSAVARLARHVRARYPQAGASLCRFAKLDGEQVYPFQRDEISRHLGARVIESYGCTEVGAIAAECPAGSLHVFSELVHVEVMRGDEVLPPGEQGELVMTSLTNRAMPLVRCRIGDRGSLSPDPCACGRPQPVLTGLEPRAADLFVAADGRLVDGAALGAELNTFLSKAPPGAVGQVLFRQVDAHHWQVLVESADGFDEQLAKQLKELVQATFGKPCAVEIKRVETVPRERSGKFRYYRRH